MGTAGTLQIRKLNKKFVVQGRENKVLEDINLTIEPGEFISIIGLSGCGKTTLLRLVVGLESEYEGDILLDGRKLNGPSIDRGIVFQDHRLFPWLNVEKNVALGIVGKNDAAKRETVLRHIERVGLKGFEKNYPHQLSGGMSQRAAIARSLVNQPEILLLDEPLGALDALTRMYMHKELERIWRQESITMIMVTHDVEEAVYLSDKIIVMSAHPGKVQKIIPVPLARPRDRASYDFGLVKEQVLEEFHLQSERHFSYAI
ncbi:MAG TPA: ABC transporter ATP-binding protein [Candidatus Deferrimicrobiaceae bacterium]|jgi:ABC-type nitrate/sulfonate/bicarbonate transport system ATPase subunit